MRPENSSAKNGWNKAASATEDACFEHVFASIKRFCGTTPLSDDCTLVELIYRGHSRTATAAGIKLGTKA